MMQIQQQWHGEQIVESIEETTWQNMLRAALFLHDRLQEAVAPPFPPASRPGEPPHKRTGRGQRGLVVQPDRQTATIWIGASADAQHLMMLDSGTRRIKARPWIEATVRKYRAKLAALATGKSA